MSQTENLSHSVLLTGNEPGFLASAPAQSSPILEASYQAFLDDLSTLLPEHAGHWVAYAGKQQVGIAESKRELYRQCLAAGYSAGEFLVCGIEQPRCDIIDNLLET
jgi:hypothetical protein